MHFDFRFQRNLGIVRKRCQRLIVFLVELACCLNLSRTHDFCIPDFVQKMYFLRTAMGILESIHMSTVWVCSILV